jgi:hypothetical protein
MAKGPARQYAGGKSASTWCRQAPFIQGGIWNMSSRTCQRYDALARNLTGRMATPRNRQCGGVHEPASSFDGFEPRRRRRDLNRGIFKALCSGQARSRRAHPALLSDLILRSRAAACVSRQPQPRRQWLTSRTRPTTPVRLRELALQLAK